METPGIFWILFNAFVLLMLALDQGVFHRKTHNVSLSGLQDRKRHLVLNKKYLTLSMLPERVIL